MARGRLISRTLGSSRKFAALHQHAGKLAEFAQALYPILVANADDFGRQAGDAFTVKHAVFPTSPRKEGEFHVALLAMQHAGLIQVYHSDQGDVVQVLNFDEHQPNLHKRAQTSRFPDSPGSSGKLPEFPSELNLTELKRTQQNLTALRAVNGSNGFEAFWTVYPKKKSRADAEKAWRKLAPSPELTQQIMGAVAAQLGTPDWQKDGGRFVPHGATWLNARRWEDEADLVVTPKAAAEDWRCQHRPQCYNTALCQVRRARERGELA